MKRSRMFVGALLAEGVAMLVTAGPARGGEKYSANALTSDGSTLSMSKFWSSQSGRTGAFPGKLVCLGCDLKPSRGAMAQCKTEGHRHALSMENDSMIHPLLAGTEQVLKQIDSGELQGKEVVVHGKYYPSTSAILADRIAEAR